FLRIGRRPSIEPRRLRRGNPDADPAGRVAHRGPSIEPRRPRRGNRANTQRTTPPKAFLQLSRGVPAAETALVPLFETADPHLQLSRGVSAAETERPGRRARGAVHPSIELRRLRRGNR